MLTLHEKKKKWDFFIYYYYSVEHNLASDSCTPQNFVYPRPSIYQSRCVEIAQVLLLQATLQTGSIHLFYPEYALYSLSSVLFVTYEIYTLNKFYFKFK